MKTPLNRAFAPWVAAVMTVLTGGCVEPNGPKADAGTNAPGTSTLVEVAVPSGGTNAEATPTEPPVLRSGRAGRVFPEEITKVIELVDAGAGEEVARAYVSGSAVPYELTLDDVLYLRDIGIPDGVVAAMMRRGAEIRQQEADAAAMQTNLVNAVEQVRAAMASGGAAPTNTVEAAPAGGATAAAAPGPAPLPTATAAVPADAPTEVQPFYETLSPYGSWYQVPSYGWVWQPSVVVVNTGWSPYCHGGRWVWSDWGWYWSSEYSWGWAPFHYGRWATYPGLGWCWVPGTTWGPSWVTWRHHGSYVGWAPLPPACGWSSGVGLTWYGSGVSVGFGFGLAPSCYTFVSYGNFCHRNVSHHALPHEQGATVYNNSTVVNNVIHGNNNTIVNNGVGYDQVASMSRTEIPKARVQALPDSVDQPVRVDRLERSKDGLVVYRPTTISDAGGRPTAIRAEARPVSTSSAIASTTPSRGAGNIPTRPGFDSRFASTSNPGAGKPVESRGEGRADSFGAGTVPGAVDARPSAAITRSPSTLRTPSGAQVGATAKAVEGRAMSAPTRSYAPAAGYGNTPGAVVGPARQTTPVPLSDPSRYVNKGRVPSTVAPTAKPAMEGRGAAAGPMAPDAGVARSVAAPMNTPSPSFNRPPAANTYRELPRTVSPQSAPKVDYTRPSMGGGVQSPTRTPMSQPSAVMSAPRSSYSAPSAAPSMAAPRPSFSAPSPAVSAPRPSFSAPSPAMSAPRPSVSAPSPAGAAPSSPGRSSGGSGRNQPN